MEPKKFLNVVKKLSANFLLILAGFLVIALLAEAALRFLPVSTFYRTRPVNEHDPVIRYLPNHEYIYSHGPFFDLHNNVHTNNFGFVNDNDYDPKDQRPLIAVIGDSYIEAVMVPFPRTSHGRLAETLAPKARVYSFASSGTALCGYLKYAEYSRELFHPRKAIFVIVGNDFDESLCKYRDVPAHACFQQAGDNAFRTIVNQFTPSLSRKIVGKSQLLKYLLLNCRLKDSIKKVMKFMKGDGNAEYVANTPAQADTVKIADSELAVDEFLEKAPQAAGLKPKDILLAIDGIRPQLYSADALQSVSDSYFALMRAYFIKQATQKGYNIIDLQPAFISDYAKRGKAFEFETDNHWNDIGHQVFYETVLESGFIDSFR